ncbi:MAG: hypothetical protein ABEJ78_09905 [Haloferacaceae archaeon]
MRAQTTIDYAIGTSVFLVTVAFVVAFVPGILQPFTGGTQEEVATVDRAAATLAQDLLGSPETPYLLNETCTEAFFNGTTACGFDGGLSVRERLGLDERQRINVRIVGQDTDGDGSRDLLCRTSAGRVVEVPGASCRTRFVAGDTVPSEGADVVGRRAVYVDGRDAFVLVRMW